MRHSRSPRVNLQAKEQMPVAFWTPTQMPAKPTEPLVPQTSAGSRIPTTMQPAMVSAVPSIPIAHVAEVPEGDETQFVRFFMARMCQIATKMNIGVSMLNSKDLSSRLPLRPPSQATSGMSLPTCNGRLGVAACDVQKQAAAVMHESARNAAEEYTHNPQRDRPKRLSLSGLHKRHRSFACPCLSACSRCLEMSSPELALP
mmetsp:Transcript_90936/g.253965  ORF Transcript_90936/g.253965 Transcript_90936/m.253965 type:complete len:201 (-) Transcript_90936:316-918(-)